MDGSILLIEDDAATRHLLAGNLRHVGYTVCCAQDLVEAKTRTGETRPDLVLLDCMATGGHTLAYIHQLRCDSCTAGVAIIVIGPDQQDTVAALESGADDCIRNSLSVNEMLARIRAVLRRRPPQHDDEVVGTAGLRFDPAAHRVGAAVREFELCSIHYRLLRLFMTHLERILSRGKRLDAVWGSHIGVEERAVDIHVRRLRRAREPTGRSSFLIETIRGMGYRFRRQAAEAASSGTRLLHTPIAPAAAFVAARERRRALVETREA